MQYMLLIYGDPSAAPAYDSPEGQAEYQEWFRYTEELAQAGALVKGDPLEPPETATTVRGAGGEIVHTDGPFAETKEVIVGFDILECADLDEAIEGARHHPMAWVGRLELRAFGQ